jgi:ribosome-binding factor A
MSHRAEQVSELLKQEMNNFLIKEAEPPRDMLITITEVEVTQDLEQAWVKVSILPINQTGLALRFLTRQLHEMNRYLQRHMRLRKIPKIEFKVDDFALKYRKVEREIEKFN